MSNPEPMIGWTDSEGATHDAPASEAPDKALQDLGAYGPGGPLEGQQPGGGDGPPPDPVATGADTGIPGTFTPAGAPAPANLAAMAAIVANPNTAWLTDTYVTLGDASDAYWDGAAWVAGRAP